jgi:predicted dehydrogenase
VHTVYDFLNGVAEKKSPSPDFREAVGVQAVLEAVGQSIEEERWVKVADVLNGT